MRNPGIARDRVTIQTLTIEDGPGGSTETWDDTGSRWCRVVPLSVDARAQYGRVGSNTSHRIDFRGQVNLSLANNRFVWREKVLYPTDPPIDLDGLGRSTSIAVREAGYGS